jgi:hypothetical protein
MEQSNLSFGVDDWNIWVLKLGRQGDVQWEKTYGGQNRMRLLLLP